VNLALRAQFVHMIKNDVEFILPDENGQRVCNLACSQLSFATVKLANAFEKAEKAGTIGVGKVKISVVLFAPSLHKETKLRCLQKIQICPCQAHEFSSAVLDNVRLLVDDVRDKVNACVDLETALPPRLDLSGAGTKLTEAIDDLKVTEESKRKREKRRRREAR